MIQYIYFVKCDGCEDEHFDFFDEAKAFAINCIKNKPIITQIEVERNDFGECVDSRDLGTIWSWDELMSEPELLLISKNNTDVDIDDEFDSISKEDQSDLYSFLDNVPDNLNKNKDPEIYQISEDYLVKDTPEVTEDEQSFILKIFKRAKAVVDHEYLKTVKQANILYHVYTVECADLSINLKNKLKQNLYDLPNNLEYITTDNGNTFRFYHIDNLDDTEGLEESCAKKTLNESNSDQYKNYTIIDSKAKGCWYVKDLNQKIIGSFVTDKEAKEFIDGLDECLSFKNLVEDLEDNENTVECIGCLELFNKSECRYDDDLGWLCPDCDGSVVRCAWCGDVYPESECTTEVDLGHICNYCRAALLSRGEHLTFTEDVDNIKSAESQKETTVTLHYDDLDITLYGAQRDADDWDEINAVISYGYEADRSDVEEQLCEHILDDMPDEEYEALEDPEAYLDNLLADEATFYSYFDKYESDILDYFRDAARENAEENTSYFEYLEGDRDDYEYDKKRDMELMREGIQDYSNSESVPLQYDKLKVKLTSRLKKDTWCISTIRYTYEANKASVKELLRNYILDETPDETGTNLDKVLANEQSFVQYLKKYEEKLKDYFKEDAIKAAEEQISYEEFMGRFRSPDYAPNRNWEFVNESKQNLLKEDVLVSPEYVKALSVKLDPCPECGEKAFDSKQGYCHSCGLGIEEENN